MLYYPSILIIDDEISICQSLSGLLSDEGFEVTTALNGYEALKIIDAESPDLVLLDIWMPGMDGIETLKEIKAHNPFIQVIIITGHGNIETAVKAIKLGAYDMIEKPLSIDKVIVAIQNALNFRRLEEENRYLRKKTLEKNSINGNSPAILELKKNIATVANTEGWVLITGENGTGKELVARTIHQLSPRAEQPLIDINCAALSEELIEIELFGLEKGNHPEYTARKRGKFELASQGTLFLDEIGDMSLKNQAKLLRVLQEQTFRRIGGSRPIHVDVRVITATNKHLEKEIEKGIFREDLYYRLNVLPIQVPPLRERIQDIPILADVFLLDYAKQIGSNKKHIDSDALDMLSRYSWPGNVRELKNLIGRLAIMVESDFIRGHDIPPPYNPQSAPKHRTVESGIFAINDFEHAKERFEAEYLRHKFIEYENDPDKAAEAIGIKSNDLMNKLKANIICHY